MQFDPRNDFTISSPMNCPAVLLLVFNRPMHSKLVLDVLRNAQPEKLYISSDGANADIPGEAELVEKVREVTATIDWDCEVKTVFHQKNLGCRIAVSSAIDWFFEHEKEGIILEDDCLPSLSFFRYCADLLSYYRDDEQIMCISGDNFQHGRSVSNDSYYFSKYNHCWGWATWRRAWSHFDADMSSWIPFRDSGGLNELSEGSNEFVIFWKEKFDNTAAGNINSWAYRWTFSCWSRNGLTCLPNKNLVKNIGFGSDATHTKISTDWKNEIEADELEFPLIHPEFVVRNSRADIFTDQSIFGINDKIHSSSFLTSKKKLRNSWLYSRLRSLVHRIRKY